MVQLYDQFVSKVAERRGRAFEEIERVARGRVWVGSQAKEYGLVDELGHLDDAIRSAADLAGLAEDEYRIEYFERTLGFAERFALQMTRKSAPVLRALDLAPTLPRGLATLLEAASEPIAFVQRFNDPRGAYAYCFCDVR